MKYVLILGACLGYALVLAGCADSAATLSNALAKADVGVARAKDYATVVCDNRNILFAVAQTAMGLAGMPSGAWVDEARAEAEMIDLCEHLPANTAQVLPELMRIKARIEGSAG